MIKTRILGIVLIAAGLSIVIYGLYIRHDILNTQRKIIGQFERMIDSVNGVGNEISDSEIFNANLSSNSGINEANGDSNCYTDDNLLKIEGINVIGIMEIPKIDLKVAIAEGTDKQTLKKAVGHFEGTAMPGEIGNFAVAGHRSYTYNEFFNRLDEMEIGDEIRVKTTKGEFVYEVTDIFVVEPHEVWVLDPTPEATITLVTCTPIRVATHRLIVKGKLKN